MKPRSPLLYRFAQRRIDADEAVYRPLIATSSRVLSSPGGRAGAACLLLFLVIALFAPALTPYDPYELSPADAMQPPSIQHPAGTDRLGRDILTRIFHGTRISLQMGLISVGIGASLGVLLGLISGYFGGWIDSFLTFIMNILLALPGILLALVIMASLGPGLSNVMIAVGFSAMPSFARVTRGSTLAVKAKEYVQAAEAMGCSSFRIIARHILPNTLGPIIVMSTLWFATSILIGASVSYLGLGAEPAIPEWGAMVNEGRNYLRQAWWLSTMPGIAIMIIAIALNLLGDSLRDALDPRLRLHN